jgi:hypothetical protein
MPGHGRRPGATEYAPTGAATGDVLTVQADGTVAYDPPGAAGSSVDVRKNSTGSTFTRSRINFIEGSNVTLTVADDAGNDEVDVTIAASSGGGGGGLTLLEQHTASASATLDFTTWYSSTYDDYLIKLINIIPATAETELMLRLSTDGGSSYAATGYEYVGIANSTGNVGISSTGIQSTSDTHIKLFTLIGNTESYGVSGAIEFPDPGSTTVKKSVNFGPLSAPLKSGATLRRYTTSGSGFYGSTSAVNAFRILFSSGNITSGTVRVYGFAK